MASTGVGFRIAGSGRMFCEKEKYLEQEQEFEFEFEYINQVGGPRCYATIYGIHDIYSTFYLTSNIMTENAIEVESNRLLAWLAWLAWFSASVVDSNSFSATSFSATQPK